MRQAERDGGRREVSCAVGVEETPFFFFFLDPCLFGTIQDQLSMLKCSKKKKKSQNTPLRIDQKV